MTRDRLSASPKVFSFAFGGAALITALALLAISAPAQKGAAPAQSAPGGARTGTTDNGPTVTPNAAQKLTASAIQIELLEPAEGLVIPEDFRISTYENVIREVTRTKKFPHVYRAGDSSSSGEKDLVVLHMIPQAFKPGSQKEREVTTVAGATSLEVKVRFTSPSGQVLLEKDLEGKVRFYGENLAATHDLAKKVATVIDDSF